MHCLWIQIKKSGKYKLYNNIGDLSKATFWYHSNDTKRNPWVMLCSLCPIKTHPAVYTLLLTLQLCYKSLAILQKVTKSKIETSSHNLLQKLHNIDFAWHRSQGSFREWLEKQEFPAFPIDFFENNQNLFFRSLIVSTPY